MATEYEIKFQATPAVLAEIEAAFSGETVRISMETTYYDTPSGSLSAKKYTLRKRLENGISVCTLKAPAGNARGEWEVNCESVAEALPQLAAMGCPADVLTLASEGLIPICGARFTRLAKTVSLENGVVELALDEGVLTGGNRQMPLCEAEVELKDGPVEVCDSFARELAVRFGLKAEGKSKFRRALGLYKGE